jgi:hypothetical protein
MVSSMLASLIPATLLAQAAFLSRMIRAVRERTMNEADEEDGSVRKALLLPEDARVEQLSVVAGTPAEGRRLWRCCSAPVLLFCALLVLVSAVSAYALLSWRHVWCAYPLEWHKELCAHLVEVSLLLRSAGIKHWLARGDMIALMREGDVFPWEHDLDLCILDQQMGAATQLLLTDQAERHPNFTVHALAPYKRERDGRPVPVLYIPLQSLTQSMPHFSINAGHDPFSLRTGEPIVVDLFPCADRTLKGVAFDVDHFAYCHQSAVPLPFPSLSAMRMMLDEEHIGWRTRRFEHHLEMCTMHIDRDKGSTLQPLEQRTEVEQHTQTRA